MVKKKRKSTGKKVGKWDGSKYSRYKKSRNPKSGIEWVSRYSRKPYTHVYGADRSRRRKLVGEGRGR